MSTSKLALYNGACEVLGERKLSSLAENVVMRRRLDTAWDLGVPRECLERGLWNHAMRSIQLDYSPSVEPPFGYRRAFDKPTDWVRTQVIATDPYFKQALTEYTDETGFWFAEWDTIYVRYVSDDTSFGMNFSLWPQNFCTFAEHSLAHKVAKSTTGSNTDVDSLEAKIKRLLVRSRSTDAMDEATTFVRSGWAESRRGNGRLRR